MDILNIVATVLMVLAVMLSLFEVVKHLDNYTRPYLQRYIIRILLMVPIYSLNAWIALILPPTGLYLDSFREVYESFVIYSFMKYLLNFLHYDTNLQQYIEHKPGPSHIFPFCCLPACVGGKSFMIRCKHGILQYVIVRPLTTLLAFTSQLLNFYGEGNYNPLSGYTYPILLIINNVSQVMAMYCLVIFYSGYKNELDPMQPLAKFFSIKLVVFFSFFQSVLISGLLEIDLVEDTFKNIFPGVEDKITLGRKAQEILICFDMLIAAIGHLFAFSYKPFQDQDDRNLLEEEENFRSDETEVTCCRALFNLLDFSDEKSDFSEYFGQMFQKLKSLFKFGRSLPAIESRGEQLSEDWLVQNQHTEHSINSQVPIAISRKMNSMQNNYQSLA